MNYRKQSDRAFYIVTLIFLVAIAAILVGSSFMVWATAHNAQRLQLEEASR